MLSICFENSANLLENYNFYVGKSSYAPPIQQKTGNLSIFMLLRGVHAWRL